MRKRIFAAFVCLCMMMALVPSMAYANDTVYTGGLCEHHTQHDDACGYTEGTAEIPCSHEHNESCGGLTDPAACNHTHDETCGYIPATAGTPCTFVCEVCNPQDNGNPATPSDAQPEECTCETLCTGEKVNADCPVCSAEGAELDKVCVGVASMLPVTALAVGEPATLYVGNKQVISGNETTYWTTDNSGGLTRVENANDNSANWSVRYNPTNATLTLKGANITGNYNQYYNPHTAGIYALCSQDQPVALTIELIGENTITGNYGIFLNAEISTSSYGTNATLTITGESNGSLKVSGSSSYGIFVKSGTGNASVTIENASVDAKTTQTNSGYAGVCVQSSANATGSPNISLSVDGGSLTASGGESSDGIQFVVGSHGVTSATTSLSVTDNAIVDARNGGIKASDSSMSDLSDQIKVSSGDGTNGGIVFDGSTGTVYGDVELQDNLEIKSDETLKIPDGSSLNCNDKLTNNGTINVESGGKLEGTPEDNGTITIAPTITTKTLPNGTVYTLYNQTLEATGDTPITWSLASGSTLPNGLTLNSNGTISGTPTTANTYKFTVTATNDNGSDSKEFTLSINGETKYSLTVNLNGGNSTTAGGQYTKGTKIQIDAGTKSGYRFAGWTSSNGGSFADASSASTTFTMPDRNVTVTANWKKKSSGGSVFFWDLKFDTNGGSKIDTVTEWEYSTIDLDEYVPEKEGYKFVGWYADEDLTKEIDEVYLTQDTTVYAKWEKIEEEVPEEPDEVEETEEPETISFLDVEESDWFYEAVSYAVENGLMSGMSEDIFAPNTPLTREMLAVILWNLEGNPTPNDVAPFLDVTSDKYYANAIAWANENGIVAGYGDTFGVGDFITREQFAVMLYNYAQYQGYDVSIGENVNILSYTDALTISDYAYPAMQWACGAGIINGMGDGTLAPQGKATRAEAATMLMNFCENVVK